MPLYGNVNAKARNYKSVPKYSAPATGRKCKHRSFFFSRNLTSLFDHFWHKLSLPLQVFFLFFFLRVYWTLWELSVNSAFLTTAWENDRSLDVIPKITMNWNYFWSSNLIFLMLIFLIFPKKICYLLWHKCFKKRKKIK